MNIAVVGTGYVGLVTGTCFADTGNNVICVDNNIEKINKLNEGLLPIYEPHLDLLVKRNIDQKRLSFSTNLLEAVKKSKIIFLALPTPPEEDGSADLSYVLNVAHELGKIIDEYKVIVNKSTVPIKTAEKVKNAIKKNANVDFDVVSNPEFLREGFAIDDFKKPYRVVIGTSSEKAEKLMVELYQPFVRQGNPIMIMDEKSAELTKYAANSFLATKITFMNEIANYCEKVGADVDKVRKGIGTDARIGKSFLYPGIGYGGSCFPKDILALKKAGKDIDYDFKIIDAVLSVNNKQKLSLVEKVINYFGDDLSNKTFALWGLAFKPETDDIREAPALYMIKALLKLGAKIISYDPEAMQNVKELIGDEIQYVDNSYEALRNVDALLIATEWSAFRNPDFDKMQQLMKSPIIFDGRNLYDLETMNSKSFFYQSIGRATVNNLNH